MNQAQVCYWLAAMMVRSDSMMAYSSQMTRSAVRSHLWSHPLSQLQALCQTNATRVALFWNFINVGANWSLPEAIPRKSVHHSFCRCCVPAPFVKRTSHVRSMVCTSHEHSSSEAHTKPKSVCHLLQHVLVKILAAFPCLSNSCIENEVSSSDMILLGVQEHWMDTLLSLFSQRLKEKRCCWSSWVYFVWHFLGISQNILSISSLWRRIRVLLQQKNFVALLEDCQQCA